MAKYHWILGKVSKDRLLQANIFETNDNSAVASIRMNNKRKSAR